MSNLIADLVIDLQHVQMLWQLGVALFCLAVAWQLQRLYRRRAIRRADTDGTLSIGVGSVQRLIFPVSALILVLVGRSILHRWQPVNLLNIVVPLLFSLALIRIVFYMLRHTFAPGGRLRTWERYTAWTVWLGVALYITGLWPEIVGMLDNYDFRFGKQRISLLLILQGALSVLVTLLLALWLGRSIETRLMRAT
ncbi:MAG: mechanosensitive ion channel protein MscS, partial [Stutzerimonas stutzeri]